MGYGSLVRDQSVMQHYRIYVRLKRGGQGTGRELHTGALPAHSSVLDVPLVTGRIVKARIGSFITDRIKKRGSKVVYVTEVYADEI